MHQQAGNHEKAAKILLMHLIYHASADLLVRLGPSSTDATDRSMDIAVLVVERLKMVEGTILAYSPSLARLGLPPRRYYLGRVGRHSQKRMALTTVNPTRISSRPECDCLLRLQICEDGFLTSLFAEVNRKQLSTIILMKGRKRMTGYISFQRVNDNFNFLGFATYAARYGEYSESVDKIYTIRAFCTSFDSVPVNSSEESREQYWKLYVYVGQILL
jgi:hypothetical protein